MTVDRPKILLTFRKGGENGGPYVSHKRIMESRLSERYDFRPFMLENPRRMRDPRVFFKTVKQIKSEKPAAVHLAGLQSEGFLTMLACRMAGVKTVLAVHGSSTEALGFSKLARSIFKLMETYTVKKADLCYGVSDYVSGWNILKKAKHNFGTIYNIADITAADGESTLRDELSIGGDDIVITSTGRIIKDKGFDVLAEVILKLTGVYDNIKFVIAGDGAYREELARLVEENGLSGRVFLLGYRSDIDNILAASDIFVICTKHETLCISLLEAAAHKLPSVATRVGGIPEILDGDCGYLVENLDVQGFCTALSELIEDAALREQLGRKAAEKIENKFSTESILARLDKAYQTVIGG